MGILDVLYNNIAERIAGAVQRQMIGNSNKYILDARKYRTGVQPSQLKVRPNQFDDNLVMNFCGLIINRSVSQVIGGGITFDFDGDDETPEEQYINGFWNANKQEILLHRAVLAASEAGTGYMQIIPNGMIGEDGSVYPRLSVIDPVFVAMETLPEDCDIVFRYIISYKFVGPNGKEISRRRTIENVAPIVADDGTQSGRNFWVDIIEEIPEGSSRWIETSRSEWPYDFPPIIHWQNLPAIGSPYGESDIPNDILRLQDRINFSGSNLSKLVRLYAHSPRYGKMLGDPKDLKFGPDDMPMYNTPDAEIVQLPPVSDLTGALEVFKSQRQALFDITRSVDIDSMQDKLGSLTNFGLRVLYQDNLSKINTKRELLGDALEEVNRRIQILAGMQPVKSSCIWTDFLPQDEAGLITAEVAKVGASLESKQTAARNLGLDWEKEQERMTGEQSSSTNIGAEILRAFDRGGEV